jgi:hypothetical protein
MIRRLARPVGIGAALVAVDTTVGLTMQPWWAGLALGALASSALFAAILADHDHTPRDTPR